jgi:hypothetical protein
MHLQEFAENSVDFAHFQPLHGSMMVPWTDLTLPLLKVHGVCGPRRTCETQVCCTPVAMRLLLKGLVVAVVAGVP